ncbi:histidine phosphatase family protein [Halobacillus halophilus]|uniref:histidine phosphatase family protein n=1 Tax=Halobacillus halophilus TaxID=1570 RepID=UPI0013694355|nr:histidine phosphatase family protein [Halobacillus halophilus]
MDRVVDIYFIRHGLTEGNRQKQYIGWSDLPLLEEGREKLVKIKDQIPAADLIYSSDLIRCVETAELLFPGRRFRSSSSLREIHFGDWEKCTYEDLKDVDAYRAWVSRPDHHTPPNGERYAHVQRRVERFLLYLLRTVTKYSVQSAVVITHGGPLREMVSWITGTPLWTYPVHPGEGIKVKLKGAGGMSWNLLQVAPITAKENGWKKNGSTVTRNTRGSM